VTEEACVETTSLRLGPIRGQKLEVSLDSPEFIEIQAAIGQITVTRF
jgi:hypothetical protein